MKQILPNIELLNPVINVFKTCFTKPQFKHFRRYIGGLVTLQNKTIDGISSSSIDNIDQSSQNRFLTSSPWSEEKLQLRYHSKLQHIFHHTSPTLIIDDTLTAKSGHHMEEAQFHKDHCSNGYLFGHQWITSFLIGKQGGFPLFPQLYSKTTMSKIEMAQQIIAYSAKKFHTNRVLLDSWYVTTKVMKTCKKHHVEIIGCLKSNRNISFETGRWLKLGRWKKTVPKEDYTTIILDDETYRYHNALVRIKSIGIVKVLVTQQWNDEKKEWSKHFFLLATNTALTPAHIIRTYLQRWTIETFHRDVKQNLGCEAYQMRTTKGITRHLILSVLAYAILKLWMQYKKVAWTIGETIRYIQAWLFDTLIINIAKEPDPQRRWQLAKPFIRKSAKA
jgi:hypothetical protein